MSVLHTVTIKSYNGSTTLATLTVNEGSSLYMCDEGIMNITSPGNTSIIYKHSGIFLGVTELHVNAIVPLYGIGEHVEITDDFTFYVVEGALINGTWKLPASPLQVVLMPYPDGAITRQPIFFTSSNREFSSITFLRTDPDNSSKFRILYDSIIACEYKANDATFWNDDAYQIIDFGKEDQIVSKAFYQWFTSTATDTTSRAEVIIYDMSGEDPHIKKTFAPDIICITYEGVFDSNGDAIYKHSGSKAFVGLTTIEGKEEPDYAVGDTITLGSGSVTYYVIEGDEYSYYVVRASTLKEIADAIRYKTGKTELIDIENFASEIYSLRLQDVSDDEFATNEDIDNIFSDE